MSATKKSVTYNFYPKTQWPLPIPATTLESWKIDMKDQEKYSLLPPFKLTKSPTLATTTEDFHNPKEKPWRDSRNYFIDMYLSVKSIPIMVWDKFTYLDLEKMVLGCLSNWKSVYPHVATNRRPDKRWWQMRARDTKCFETLCLTCISKIYKVLYIIDTGGYWGHDQGYG